MAVRDAPTDPAKTRNPNPDEGSDPCRCLATSHSALEGTRTPNLLIRSQMLYPLSYERLRVASLEGRPSLRLPVSASADRIVLAQLNVFCAARNRSHAFSSRR